MMLHVFLLLALGMFAGRSLAAQDLGLCLEEAAARHYVSPALLWSIAKVESGFNPLARNVNRNGSEDIGIMQINSSWLPTLSRYGIRRKDLFDPCINFYVGAWVLSHNIRQYGNTWKSVGAYNAISESKQNRYIGKVQSVLARELNR